MNVKINSVVNFYTLLMISEKPQHGYELMKELERRLERKISPSQIYPFLSMLLKKGLVQSEKSGERDKKTYTLTKRGKQFAERLISRFGELTSQALTSSLTTCAHCGCRVYGAAYHITLLGKKTAFCCMYCAESFKHSNSKA